MKIKALLSLSASALLMFTNCSSDDNNTPITPPATKAAVIQNYTNIVYQSYKDSYDRAVELQTAINTFTDTPTEANFTSAKNAWLTAREPYGQTEVYRETNGPIDTPDGGTEGQINAWPLDENYIDYVRDGSGGVTSNGIINDTSITIDEATLIGANEGGTGVPEKNISTGYHAIEFLLWGQDFADPSNGLAGQRPYTDYVTGAIGTNQNQDRRATYLKVVTDILVKDLKALVDTWVEGGTYRTTFLALPEDTALKNIINGAFFISGNELAVERMSVAVEQSQEDEHSCFSDNTHRDINGNALGVNNVIFGRYGNITGASFYDLVNLTDPIQAEKLKVAADNATAKVNVIVNSDSKFDILIGQETISSPGVILEAVGALQTQAAEISAAASSINIEL